MPENLVIKLGRALKLIARAEPELSDRLAVQHGPHVLFKAINGADDLVGKPKTSQKQNQKEREADRQEPSKGSYIAQ